MIRSLLIGALALTFGSLPARAETLAPALAAAAAGDWTRAEDLSRAEGPLAFDIIEWMRLRAGQGQFADYADFSARRADWPGLPLLRKKGEGALQDAPAAQVLAYFETEAPQTAQGARALIQAHQAMGDGAQAEAVAVAAWRGLVLGAQAEAALLADHAEALKEHHGGRIAMLLDKGALEAAARMLPLVSEGTRAVASARIALQRSAEGVDALVAAVPARMAGSGGLARDRAAYRARNDNDEGAIEILLAQSHSAEALGSPQAWAKMRARYARADLRADNPARAYRISANHHLSPEDASYADFEWLAGYAALKLGDAPTALRHFEHLGGAVKSPISVARAGYWQGRALQDLGRAGEARAAFARAATQQTAFYGLLAAEEIGVPLDPALQGGALPDWRMASFTGSSVYAAAELLRAAGDAAQARRFMLHLAESLTAEDTAAMSALALSQNDPTLALKLAKRAAEGGVIVMEAYYPLHPIAKADLAVPPELALAIARRESEFNPTIASPVGAQGLMQVMPDTAKMMAKRLGQPYAPARLGEPMYNAQLGSEYLAKLREEFGASPLLVAAGYNAGPGRPRRWIEERGDPRKPSVDFVDWVEMIPFDETRNYVMRVSESLPIYRARLGLAAQPSFSEELRGR